MSELTYLNILLSAAVALGPVMTREFFLDQSKIYGWLHLLALAFLGTGFLFSVPVLYFAWLIFCLFGGLLYVFKNKEQLFKLKTMAEGIPLVFSVIASLWLVCGANDFRLLGYNQEWSYYAALHGNFLGWLLIGSITLMARTFKGSIQITYQAASFVFLVFFLLIAFGIDGVPYIKKMGVIGVALLSPALIGYYIRTLPKAQARSFYLSASSLVGLLFTLFLAVSNEWKFLNPATFLEVTSMVTLHGMLNGFVVIPSLCLAMYCDERLRVES